MNGNAMQDLLDIREAAALLRVSPTSLRRWTNAGRLPCLRIGGRHERRFRRSDLIAFLGQHDRAVPALSRNHFCGFYTSDVSRAHAAAAFLRAGLHTGARGMLVATREVQRAVVRMLGRAVPTGGLPLAEYHDSATAQFEFWRARLRAALQSGVSRVHIVGDVSGGQLGRLPFAEILEYEAEYARSISRDFPVVTLCLYDARSLSGLDVAGLLQHHDGGAHAGYRSEH